MAEKRNRLDPCMTRKEEKTMRKAYREFCGIHHLQSVWNGRRKK